MTYGKLATAATCLLVAAMTVGCGKNTIERSREFTRQGYQFYKEKNYPEAVKALNTALELNPGDARALYYLGTTYKDYDAMADNTAAAEKALEGAIAMDMNMLEAYVMLCSILIKEKQYDKAENVANRAIKVHGDKAEPHYWLAVSYAQRERYEEALEKCKTALRMNPSDAPTAALMTQIKSILE